MEWFTIILALLFVYLSFVWMSKRNRPATTEADTTTTATHTTPPTTTTPASTGEALVEKKTKVLSEPAHKDKKKDEEEKEAEEKKEKKGGQQIITSDSSSVSLIPPPANPDVAVTFSIVFIGDAGVGKTSLLQKVVGEYDESQAIPATLSPIRLTKDVVALDFVDTSADESWDEQLKREIRHASWIFLLFDINNPATMVSIEKKWLPKIHEVRGSDMPLLGVLATKADDDVLDEEVIKTATQWDRQNIQLVTYCSTLNERNINAVWLSYRLLVNPIDVLYASRERKQLSMKFSSAVEDIFLYFDNSGIGKLNDEDLIAFHKFLWDKEVDPAGITQLKAFLQKRDESSVSDDLLTLAGFTELLKLFICKEKINELWRLLRKFGYDNKLEITGSRATLQGY